MIFHLFLGCTFIYEIHHIEEYVSDSIVLISFYNMELFSEIFFTFLYCATIVSLM